MKKTKRCPFCYKGKLNSEMCQASDLQGYHCTRKRSHRGSHVACGVNEHEISKWLSTEGKRLLREAAAAIGKQPNSRLRDPQK